MQTALFTMAFLSLFFLTYLFLILVADGSVLQTPICEDPCLKYLPVLIRPLICRHSGIAADQLSVHKIRITVQSALGISDLIMVVLPVKGIHAAAVAPVETDTELSSCQLMEKGKVDPEKLHALMFDQFRNGYYATGAKVGKAWNAGAGLMKK